MQDSKPIDKINFVLNKKKNEIKQKDSKINKFLQNKINKALEKINIDKSNNDAQINEDIKNQEFSSEFKNKLKSSINNNIENFKINELNEINKNQNLADFDLAFVDHLKDRSEIKIKKDFAKNMIKSKLKNMKKKFGKE